MTATLEHLAGGIGIVRNAQEIYFVPYSGDASTITEEQAAGYSSIDTERVHPRFSETMIRTFESVETAVQHTKAYLAFNHLLMSVKDNLEGQRSLNSVYYESVKKNIVQQRYDELLLSVPAFVEQGFDAFLKADLPTAMILAQEHLR